MITVNWRRWNTPFPRPSNSFYRQKWNSYATGDGRVSSGLDLWVQHKLQVWNFGWNIKSDRSSFLNVDDYCANFSRRSPFVSRLTLRSGAWIFRTSPAENQRRLPKHCNAFARCHQPQNVWICWIQVREQQRVIQLGTHSDMETFAEI